MDLVLISQTVQRWLRNKEVATIDQAGHVAEEKSQQQGADMTSVYVSIGHNQDPPIAQTSKIEIITYAGA